MSAAVGIVLAGLLSGSVAAPLTPREKAMEARIAELERRLGAIENAHQKESPKEEVEAAREALEREELLRITDLERKLGKHKGRAETGPSNKGMVIESNDGRYRGRLGMRMQSLYQGQNYDTLGGPATGLTDKDGFFVRRMKIFMEGQLGRPETTFRWQVEAARAQGILDDAYIEHAFLPELRVRLGEMKPANSRQVISSTREFVFTERALSTLTFAFNSPGTVTDPRDIIGLQTHGAGRTAGMQVWGDFKLKDDVFDDKSRNPTVRYFATVNNGSGQNVNNENAGLQQIYRLELHPLGYYGYAEGAQDEARQPYLVLDAGHSHDDSNQRIEIDGVAGLNRNDREDRDISNLGLAFRWRKFYLQSEYFRQWTSPEGSLTRRVGGALRQIPIDGIGSRGWYYQMSFMLYPKRLELAFRDGAVDPNRARNFDYLRETGWCANYYFEGHPHALQLELLRLTDDANPLNDHTRSRLQYELTF